MFYLQKKELMFVKRNCPAAINKINVVLSENFPPQIFGQILYYKNSPNFFDWEILCFTSVCAPSI